MLTRKIGFSRSLSSGCLQRLSSGSYDSGEFLGNSSNDRGGEGGGIFVVISTTLSE